ncbi:MAG: hypothetical protein AB7O50_05900 [Pseudolabrys sp.]
MMGSRGWKGGAECDVLSYRYRRMIRGRVHTKKIKRKFWKRMRRRARMELHGGD